MYNAQPNQPWTELNTSARVIPRKMSLSVANKSVIFITPIRRFFSAICSFFYAIVFSDDSCISIKQPAVLYNQILSLYLASCHDVNGTGATTSMLNRDDSRLAPSQWETSLQSNAVSHWLGANLESALLWLSAAYLGLLLLTQINMNTCMDK